jgi:hypothetical protein
MDAIQTHGKKIFDGLIKSKRITQNIEFSRVIAWGDLFHPYIFIGACFHKRRNEPNPHIGIYQSNFGSKGIDLDDGPERLREFLVPIDVPDHFAAAVVHGDDCLVPQLFPVEKRIF